MTDIAKLRDDVIEAAKQWYHGGEPHLRLGDAVAALRAAEEVSKRPRLRRPGNVVVMIKDRHWCVPELIEARDAELMAAIRKLPRYVAALHQPYGLSASAGNDCNAILLSDIESLTQEAKT